MGTTGTTPSPRLGEAKGTPSFPEWSGKFEELPSGLGMMLVHMDDHRAHQPPPGWVFLDMDPLNFLGDTQAYMLEPA